MGKFVTSISLMSGIALVFGVVGFAGIVKGLPGKTIAGVSLASVRAGHTEDCVDAGKGECKVTGGVAYGSCWDTTVGKTCGENYGPFNKHCTVIDPEEDGDHCTPKLNQKCAAYFVCRMDVYGRYYCDVSNPIAEFGWSLNTCTTE